MRGGARLPPMMKICAVIADRTARSAQVEGLKQGGLYPDGMPSFTDATAYAAEVHRLVLAPEPPEPVAFSARVVDAVAAHVNPGLLAARKSVTETGDEAAVEWSGEGSILRDASGREYIDLLGGYGIYNLGIRH